MERLREAFYRRHKGANHAANTAWNRAIKEKGLGPGTWRMGMVGFRGWVGWCFKGGAHRAQGAQQAHVPFVPVIKGAQQAQAHRYVLCCAHAEGAVQCSNSPHSRLTNISTEAFGMMASSNKKGDFHAHFSRKFLCGIVANCTFCSMINNLNQTCRFNREITLIQMVALLDQRTESAGTLLKLTRPRKRNTNTPICS